MKTEELHSASHFAAAVLVLALETFPWTNGRVCVIYVTVTIDVSIVHLVMNEPQAKQSVLSSPRSISKPYSSVFEILQNYIL